jgi:hypothetical protein
MHILMYMHIYIHVYVHLPVGGQDEEILVKPTDAFYCSECIVYIAVYLFNDYSDITRVYEHLYNSHINSCIFYGINSNKDSFYRHYFMWLDVIILNDIIISYLSLLVPLTIRNPYAVILFKMNNSFL